ncbi:apolipoprotein L2-like isoform X2 [Osmerus mordax]|uniref:apolipoprotein L2-like isoform X2 n=1 Tax=Osmerus mordax TaxID=8014 RepID=UPI00350F98F2
MNIFKRDKVTSASPVVPQDQSTEDNTSAVKTELPTNTKGTGVMGVIQRVNPFRSPAQSSSSATKESTTAILSTDTKQNPGVLKGVFQKVNPFKSSTPTQVKGEESHTDTVDHQATDKLPVTKQPGAFSGMIQKVNPFRSNQPSQIRESSSLDSDLSSSADSLVGNNNITEKNVVWYTDGEDAGSGVEAQSLEEPNTRDAGTSQSVEPSAVSDPGEGTPVDWEDDEEGLLDWWRTVEGWEEWNEANPFEEDEGVEAVEAVADRVFMAARLFVRLFNLRGASLQQRILELLSLADAADLFHKKTMKASVGGGVASVAGSITTITGLILAPFTMGTSLIVTAVGIGVATAGGVASASANITDTMHSKTDRKKVEKMIQDYQEEMRDIKECLDFVQVGMATLEEWNFEQYADSINKNHLNQNVKHVMKEGGRAGKALLINTESLISTVQVLSVAGGAAKAVQVMSVATGVMSGLFLALDVFFLAKDSLELRKGAKTEFAAKIREVCTDLQKGLLELNHIKEELQKTMDGMEVEEVEVEEEEEEDEEEEKEEEEDEEREEEDKREETTEFDSLKQVELEE